ncbi:MAG: hypothetical protein ACK5AR_08185, partial [Flavobacteriia bacterium]
VAPAVARAAMESGVAQEPIQNWEEYQNQLKSRLGLDNKLQRNITTKAHALWWCCCVAVCCRGLNDS